MLSHEPEDDSGDEGDEDYAALGLVRLVRNNVSTVSAAIANQGWETQSADDTDQWNQDVMDDFHERKDAPMKFTKRKRATPNKGHGRREAFYDGRIMPIQEAKQLVIKRAPSGLGSVFTKIIEDLMRLAHAVVGLEAYNIVPLIFPFFICNGIEGILYRTYIEWPFMRTRSTPLFLTNEAFDVCEEKTFQAAFLWQRDMDDPYFTTGEWDTSSEDDENESDDDDEDDPGEVSLRKIILDSGLFPSDVVTMITNYVGDFTPFIGEVQRVIFGLPYDEHPNGIDNPVNYILPVGLHSVAMVRDNSIRVYNILSGEMMWLSHHRAAHMTDSTISNAFMLRNKSSRVTTQLVSVTDNVMCIYSAATGDQLTYLKTKRYAKMKAAPMPNGKILWWDNASVFGSIADLVENESVLAFAPRNREYVQIDHVHVLSMTKLIVITDCDIVQIWEWNEEISEFDFVDDIEPEAKITEVLELHDGRLLLRGLMNDIIIMEASAISYVQLTGHMSYVTSMMQMFNGMIVTGSLDNCVVIWHPGGAILHTLRSHCGDWHPKNDEGKGGIRGLVELPGGLIASCGVDRSICIWDHDTGKLVNVLLDNDCIVTSLVRIGRYLISGGTDGNMVVWI